MSSNPQPPAEPGTAITKAEVGSLTPDQRRTVSAVAGIWNAEWTSLEKLKPPELQAVARLIVNAYPDFSEIEILKYFTILGGRFYETAEFWLHQVAPMPDYRGVELTQVVPGTPMWNEYMGEKQAPEAIAAAVLCAGQRQRYHPNPARNWIQVEREVGYVTIGDPILSEYSWVDLPPAIHTKAEAEAYAQEQGLTYDRVFGKAPPNAPPNAPQQWAVRVAKPRPDAIALAFKKARTIASRRCLRRLFSLAEARVSSTLAAINKRLEERLEPHARFGQMGEGKVRVPLGNGLFALMPENEPPAVRALSADEYAGDARKTPREPEPPAEAPRPPKAESQHDAAADRAVQLVSEDDRRKLYADLEHKDISTLGTDGDHEALKVLIRQMKGLQPAAPVSTKDLTYPEWEQLRSLIDQLPQEKPATDTNPPPFGPGELGGAA